MKCQTCGAEFDEGPDVCPACHKNLRDDYLTRGPSASPFARKWMHLSWAIRWAMLMVVGLIFGPVLIVASISSNGPDSGSLLNIGFFILLLGILGTYMTYLNFVKR